MFRSVLYSTIKKVFPRRFLFAKHTNLPIFGKLLENLFFKDDDVTYLPLDHTIHIDIELNKPEEFALPSQIVERLIMQSEHFFILNECVCRASNSCSTYPQSHGCLFIGRAGQSVSSRFGYSASREQALAHLQRSKLHGFVNMAGRNLLDTIVYNAKPRSELITICSCCDCCCLYGILPDASESLNKKVNRLKGLQVQVNELCDGCEDCVSHGCIVNAISFENSKAKIDEECIGCGRCVDVCPVGAIELVFAEGYTLQSSFDHISSLSEIF